MRDIHICFTIDENYAPYCGVAITSIIKNKASTDRLHIYILNQKLSEDIQKKLLALSVADKCIIQIINMPVDLIIKLKDAPMPEESHNNSIETYFRIFIPEIFCDLNRVLYLDTDIIVKRSLGDLFFMDMQDQLLAMVKDIYSEDKQCFNSGVILMDCGKWRKENIGRQLIEFMKNDDNKRKFTLHDQDLLNFTLSDRIYELDCKWNKYVLIQNTRSYTIKKDDAILHFITDVKPWHGVYQNDLIDEYFDYLNDLSWGVEDKRERNKNLNATRYYEAREMLVDLITKGKLEVGSTLILLSLSGSMGELMYAAMDLGFSKIQNLEICDIPAIISKKTCMISESYFDYETKYILEQQGYRHGLNYYFLRRRDIRTIEKIVLQSIQLYLDKTDTKLGIVIYGTANWAQKFTEILENQGIDIVFYADSSPEKWGEMFYGKEVISPDRLKEIMEENTIIIIASSAFKEIKEGLLKRGIDEGKILTFEFMRNI